MLERTLKPLTNALSESKQIRSTLSVPGHLIDWCGKHRREYVRAIRELAGDKRIELVSGGYYDPIFPLIPRADSIEHIERTSTAISKLYRRKPRGIWVNQLLWESSLIGALAKCAMEYTFLRDVDWIDYSVEQQSVASPMITEHAGKSITVFPIATRLCRLWHEHKFRSLMHELRNIYDATHSDERAIVTLADYSEEQRSAHSIHRFFQILSKNSDWIETIRPTDIPRQSHAMRTSYFYSQKLHTLRRNVGQNSEVGHIYASMHYNHTLVSQLRGDKQRKHLAKELALQGQNYYSFMDQNECRYSTHRQRKYAYGVFIEAAQMVYKEKQKRPTIIASDYDFDGVPEFLLQNDAINAIVHRKGGMLTRIGSNANRWSWLDMPSTDRSSDRMFSRISKTTPQSRLRNCGIDYLIPTQSIGHAFFNAKIHTYSLFDHLYNLIKIDHEQSMIHLQTTTELKNGSDSVDIDINKKIQFDSGKITMSYQMQNKLDSVCDAIFATQLNLSPSLEYFNDLEIEYLDITGKTHPVAPTKTFLRLTEPTTICIRSAQQGHMFSCDCSGSNTVFLYRFQEQKAITIIPCWQLLLGPQDLRSLQVVMEIQRIPGANRDIKEKGARAHDDNEQ